MAMQETIQTDLLTLEAEENVRILYACESGSRAWGFPSRDSDFDVRFIYIRPRDWYLSIDLEHRRDVIERPISDQLDLSGWDIRKALQLLRKSNPPLLEWINSPIVYLDRYDAVTHLRGILPAYYSPIASMFHYLHMARGNFRDYLRSEPVWVKKYFYVLRPLLAVKWIEAGKGVVPTEFGELLDGMITEPALRAEIDDLLARKIAGDELDRGPRYAVISDFIEAELTRLESVPELSPALPPPVEEANRFFRQMLSVVWDK